jgi:isocitrate dehydrogenase kinase/phosphatase
MAGKLGERPVAERGGDMIRDAYLTYTGEFHRLTRRARVHFEDRDWHGVQCASVDRLALYTLVVGQAVEALRALLGPGLRDHDAWRALKTAFFERVAGRRDLLLAETFFNSITRRIFTTVGIDPEIEFASTGAPGREPATPGRVTDTFRRSGTLRDLARAILDHYSFGCGYEDAARDAGLIARAIEIESGGDDVLEVELAQPVFFRNKSGYLVGRVVGRTRRTPLAIALTNEDGRVAAEAVLLTENEVSIVFSFARAYFMVDTDFPVELVEFLREIMPKKPVAELYNAIGHNKHGKTEFYRALRQHLAASDDQFQVAPGVRGMVMVVFVLPSYDVVFKVIRDRFEPPKTGTREDVRERYSLVFKHDRAGRLVDAQEFEHLEFEKRRFSDPVLNELLASASESVMVKGDSVVIRHLYTERRLVPLDLYLRNAPPDAARRAVIDYGTVLRDLAATNIFPGDLLLKNFGVSRHGRVIFYDYDELCLLSDCEFRALPEPRDDEEETAGEPWFYVGERDIFPEEFGRFLGLRGELRDLFLSVHGDLLRPEFWQGMQEEHRKGRVLDIFPYGPSRRLRAGAGNLPGLT